MKKIISIIALLMLVVVASAQNISVASFKPLLHDQSANLQGTMKIDQNGEVCAIIKVQTTATGLTFDVGSLGIVATEQKAGEVWVYVPHGVKRISIGHPTLGFIRDYSIPCSVDAARTYELVLTTGTVHTVIEEAVTQQYVMFEVQPQNATVEINNQTLEVKGGTATKRLPFGKYSYRVQASRYYPEAGMVTVNDPNNKHVVKVQLKPAFSSFTFKSSDPQAQIWVNGEQKGVGQWTGEMEYESVLLECKRENHRSTRKEVTLDASMTQAPIQLDAPTPIYGSLDINSSPAGADIFVDNTKVGTTPMFLQKHLIGEHNIRISLNGYQEYSSAIKIEEGKTANLNAELEKITDPYYGKSAEDLYDLGYDAYAVKDYSTAFSVYQKLAEMGEAEGQNLFGDLYWEGVGVAKDYEKAIYWYQKAANQGNATGQKNLGVMYSGGFGVEQDYKKAMHWWQKAADQGLAEAKYYLGMMYYRGNGVKQDYAKAVDLLQKAADQGYAKAQTSLGSMYYQGHGMEQDYHKAAYWFNKAAKQGEVLSQQYLGFMYSSGIGVQQDISEAIYWLQKGAEQGNIYCLYNLGRVYEYGIGVTKNIATAKSWYQKAADQGDEDAKKALQRLK